MGQILVTPRSITSAGGHAALRPLSEAGFQLRFSAPGKLPTEAELIALLPGCIGYLAGVEPITAAVLEAATQLKVISRNGTGVDAIDATAAAAMGIRICRAEGANARGVAELTIGLLLAVARGIPLSDRELKAGNWQRTRGFELEGKTLGLIGCGQVGRLVAQLATGFEMQILAHDVAPDLNFAPTPSFRYAPLDEVLGQSDILSLHCPPPADGHAVLDQEALRRLKSGVTILNTARAELIDRQALAARIREGDVRAVGIDVYETEPPHNDPLVPLDAVIATPHIGGFTSESIERAVSLAVENLLRALQDATAQSS